MTTQPNHVASEPHERHTFWTTKQYIGPAGWVLARIEDGELVIAGTWQYQVRIVPFDNSSNTERGKPD